MTRSAKKLLFYILIATIIVAGLFWKQVKRARTIVTSVSSEPLISAEAWPIPIAESDPLLGNPGAAITLVEFIDLSDEKSLELHAVLEKFVRAHPQEARLIWKDFPKISVWSEARLLPHLALWCAKDQKQFWPFMENFLKAPAKDSAALAKLATLPGLSLPAWENCLAKPEANAALSSALIIAQSLGIKTAPALFINNKRLNLAPDVDVKELLTSLIQK